MFIFKNIIIHLYFLALEITRSMQRKQQSLVCDFPRHAVGVSSLNVCVSMSISRSRIESLARARSSVYERDYQLHACVGVSETIDI